jgi:replicative DNA helicase
VDVSRRLQNLPLFIDDTPALTVSSLRTRARRLKRQGGLDLIVIDYLQLLQSSDNRRSDNRVQEISEITRSLKALAKELNVPVIALSQLSRAVEQRDDKRPQLADLRESGSIEQDADVVMFVFREEYYESRREPAEGTEKHREWQQRMAEVYNVAEVIIAKQRHGPVGTVRLFYEGRLTKFGNLTHD